MKKFFFLLFLYSIPGYGQLYTYGNKQVCVGDELKIYAYGDSSFSWASFSDPDSIISTQYYLEITVADSTPYWLYSPNDTLLVPILYDEHLCICRCFIPNVFTPDGDLFNDTFRPIINCGKIQGVRMTIYNRMNAEVFDETAYDWVEWDGKHPETGEPLSQGLYLWWMSFIDEDGKTHHFNGHVFLFR